MTALKKLSPRSALSSLPGTELVRTYVWEKPVRIAHWLIFFAFVALSFTGLYIHRPFLTPGVGPSFLMARMRFVHEVSGFVLIAALALRVYWFFKGNVWARWSAFIPVRRDQWTGIGSMLEFYLFMRFDPGQEVGHNPLAALSYFIIYVLILVEVLTGLVLFDQVFGNPALHQVVGWMPLLVNVSYLRLSHYVLTFIFFAFVLFHVYASVLVSLVEENGLLDSIFSGWKFIPAKVLREDLAKNPEARRFVRRHQLLPSGTPKDSPAGVPPRRRPGPGPVTLYRNWISYAGTGIAAVSVLVFAILTAYHTVGGGALSQPYGDLVLFIVPPVFLLIGVAVVLGGMYLEWIRWRMNKPLSFARYPKWDLNVARERKALLAVTVASAILVVPATYGTGQAYIYTDAVPFCGSVCHSMAPEYVTYQRSPHARVGCAQCHIAPGVSGYVVAKTRGMIELAATISNDFPRPIPVTAMALRPARQNCEQCHWSGNVVAARHVRRTYSLADEHNTPWEIEMTVPIGGAADGRAPAGAHWHVATTVEYSGDATGQTIPWVRSVDRATGVATVYTAEGQSPSAPPASEVRTMDCVDCHNRPSHQLRAPDESVDAALAAARIDRALPYIKQQSVAALTAPYPSHEQALQGIDRALRGYYQKNYPQDYERQQPSIVAAISALQDTYGHEFFPAMNVQWNTYPTNDGHYNSAGCGRCHDGQHKSVGGRVIPADCATCHQIVAQGTPGSMEFASGPRGLTFKHPVDILDLWMTAPCSSCHTGGAM